MLILIFCLFCKIKIFVKLDLFDFNSIYSQLDIHQCYLLPDSLFDNSNSAVSNSLEIFAPITESANRSYSKSPWFSNELFNLHR